MPKTPRTPGDRGARPGRGPRPRVLVRDEDDTLVLRPGWRFIVLGAVVGLGLLVGLVLGAADGSVSLGLGAAILVIALVSLTGATWLARAREALLVVGPHGISSPLIPHGGPVAWDQVAAVHASGWLLPTFTVSVWRNPADQHGNRDGATKIGLRLPPGLAPMTGRRLRREVEQRRARHTPPAPDAARSDKS